MFFSEQGPYSAHSLIPQQLERMKMQEDQSPGPAASSYGMHRWNGCSRREVGETRMRTSFLRDLRVLVATFLIVCTQLPYVIGRIVFPLVPVNVTLCGNKVLQMYQVNPGWLESLEEEEKDTQRTESQEYFTWQIVLQKWKKDKQTKAEGIHYHWICLIRNVERSSQAERKGCW